MKVLIIINLSVAPLMGKLIQIKLIRSNDMVIFLKEKPKYPGKNRCGVEQHTDWHATPKFN